MQVSEGDLRKAITFLQSAARLNVNKEITEHCIVEIAGVSENKRDRGADDEQFTRFELFQLSDCEFMQVNWKVRNKEIIKRKKRKRSDLSFSLLLYY